MTHEEAAKITAHLAQIYVVPAWTRERLAAFAQAISDLDYVACQHAAQAYIHTQREAPLPADLRKLVAQATSGNAPGPEAAWGEFHEKLQRHDTWPTFWSHTAIGEAIRLTGRDWTSLRLLQFDQYQWLRRDFLAAYREVTERLQTQTQLAPGALPPPTKADAVAILEQISGRDSREKLFHTAQERPKSTNEPSDIAGTVREILRSTTTALEAKAAAASRDRELTLDEIAARREQLRRQLAALTASDVCAQESEPESP